MGATMIDPVSMSLVFESTRIAHSLGAMAGIVQDSGATIDLLSKSELSAGMRALDQARNATREHDSLLREARAALNKAVGLESGMRKGLALLGLATCHHWLKEPANAQKALNEILDIEPVSRTDIAKTAAMNAGRSAVTFRRENLFLPWTLAKSTVKAALAPVETARKVGNLLSEDTAKDIQRRLTLEAIEQSSDAQALVSLQQVVAQRLNAPIPWIAQLQ